MDSLENCIAWCIGVFIAGGVIGCVVGANVIKQDDKDLKRLANRYVEQSEGVIKDRETNTLYYSDSIVDAKLSSNIPSNKWYIPQDLKDDKDIRAITQNMNSYGDYNQVRTMLEFMGVKKRRLASLVEGYDGFPIAYIYERCERYVLHAGHYDKIEGNDSLLLTYLKGDKKIRKEQVVDACDIIRQPHIIMYRESKYRILKL